ncbi:MAG: metallophosphoesterase [Deltaproteobacteria bacterium]|nr:metallophosphoesterase [Deltaproteobacteria bacterium]
MKRIVSKAGLAVLLMGGAGPTACAKAPPDQPASPRVIAIGDLHGDLEHSLAVLRLADLVDDQGRWAGGSTVLVQTGDVTDRGPDSKGVIDLLRRLADEAQDAGGKVVVLLGNHEVMNLHGDWRYVHPDDVASFGGMEARVAAFGLDGEYGHWLANLDAVTIEGDAVFVHGGITPAWAARGVAAINAEVHKAVLSADGEVLGEDGPLWYRGFVADPEEQACAALGESLRSLNVRRMVVGHTTSRDGKIAVRCSGRLHVIDVGISSAYGGNLAVWELTEEDAGALYSSGPVDLEDPAP